MRDLQEKVKNFCEDHDLTSTSEIRLLDTISELGEVAKELLLSSDYGKRTTENNERIEEEIGDTIFSLIALSNSFEIDMEAALNKVLKKYESRAVSDSIGSRKND